LLTIITKYFFYLLAFTPIIGYLLRGLYGLKVAAITLFGNIALFVVILMTIKFGYLALKKPKYFMLGMLFAIYWFIWGQFNGIVEFSGLPKLIFANPFLLILFVFIIIENTSFSERFIKRLILLFKITIVISFIVSLIQVLVDSHFFYPQQLIEETDTMSELGFYEIRNQSIFGYLDQNDIGLSFVPIISLFVGYHFYNKNNLIFMIFVIIAGLVCFLTNGRYVMINFILIFCQVFFLKNLTLFKKIRYLVSSVILIGLIITGLTYLGYDINDFWEERIMSESGNSRIIAFDMFGRFFGEHPLFGTGVRTNNELMSALYGRSSQIHVGYLSAFFEWGIVGASLIFIYWYRIAKDLYKKAKLSLFYGAFFGFMTFLIANTVLVQYTILFYGLIYCFVFSKYYYNIAGFENKNHLISI